MQPTWQTEFRERPLLWIAIALASGILMKQVPIAALAVPVLIAALRTWKAGAAVGLATLGGFVTGPVRATPVLERDYYYGPLRIESAPRSRFGNLTVTGRDSKGDRVRAQFPGRSTVAYGEQWTVRGVRRPIGIGTRDYWLDRGVGGEIRISQAQLVSPGTPLDQLTNRLRRGFSKMTALALPDSPAALLDALCINGGGSLDPELGQAFRASGAVHLLSASGFHVVVLSAISLALLSVMPIPRLYQLLILLCLLVVYAGISGWEVPVCRAALVSSILSFAYLARREPDLISALAASAIVTLLWRPWSLYDPGSQMSYLTVGAFAVLLPRIGEDWTPLRAALDGLRASAVAAVAVAPLTAYYFGTVSLVSILGNVVVASVVSAIILLGFAAFAISAVSVTAGKSLLVASLPLLGWVERSVTWVGNLPFAQIRLEPFSGYWVIAIYVIGLLIGALVPHRTIRHAA